MTVVRISSKPPTRTRLLSGGDWPFALLAADDYGQIWRGIETCLARLSVAERGAVLHDNAAAVYGLAA